MIYFIQAGEDGPVKIGKADNPVKRLAALQIGSSERLYIRAVLDEPDEVEGRLHRMLEKFRVNGEWFKLEIETMCAMACAIAGFIPPSISRVRRQGPTENLKPARKQRWDADKYRAYMRMHMAVTRAVKAGRAMWLKVRP